MRRRALGLPAAVLGVCLTFLLPLAQTSDDGGSTAVVPAPIPSPPQAGSAVSRYSREPRPGSHTFPPNVAGEIFRSANQAYRDGDFQRAADQYVRLVQGGWGNALVHYNLGNAFYRLGKLGAARLAYERALVIDPGSREARDNLEFVAARTVDQVEEEDHVPGPLQMLGNWHQSLSPWLVTVFFLLCWLAFNICLAGALFFTVKRLKRLCSYLLVVSLLGVLLAGIGLGLLIYQRDAVVKGIVMTPKADLVSVPGEGGIRITTVHEGLKVRIRRGRGHWLEVTLPNGFQGWLPGASVGLF